MGGKWVPGALINQFRKRFLEPRLVIVCDQRLDHQALTEASYRNIPIIALCDSEQVKARFGSISKLFGQQVACSLVNTADYRTFLHLSSTFPQEEIPSDSSSNSWIYNWDVGTFPTGPLKDGWVFDFSRHGFSMLNTTVYQNSDCHGPITAPLIYDLIEDKPEDWNNPLMTESTVFNSVLLEPQSTLKLIDSDGKWHEYANYDEDWPACE